MRDSSNCPECGTPLTEGNIESEVKIPSNSNLPFFSYGIFKPTELAFHSIKKFTSKTTSASVKGCLFVRDGLPILDNSSSGIVKGVLIKFQKEDSQKAYTAISAFEPYNQYRWIETKASGNQSANILLGRNPRKGSRVYESDNWSGRDDPFFTKAMDVVEDVLIENQKFAWDLEPLFQLEMGYLLLWSIIERFVSLRYLIGGKTMKRIYCLAENKAFCDGLSSKVLRKRTVYRADRPQNKVELDPSNPKRSIEYYYQIRSNITHRGKAVINDFEILHESFTELFEIVKMILDNSFSSTEEAS